MTYYQFPTYEDRLNAHNLIIRHANAKGEFSRVVMMIELAKIITKYNLTTIPIFNYSIHILGYSNLIPIISIINTRLSDDCPDCKAGSESASYFRTERENHNEIFDVISIVCLNCGCVYSAKASNGRTNINKLMK